MSITALKAKNDIIDVAERLGIKVDPKTGKALCPFHNDKNPSLQFSKEKQIVTCFSGNCSAGTMDVITLVEKYLKVSNVEAIKWLNPLSNISGNVSKQPTLLQRLEKSSKHAFTSTKQAQVYAELRCLEGDLCSLGGEFYRNWSENDKKEGERIGLLKKYRLNQFTSAFKNRLVFCLRDKNGIPVSIYGRAIDNKNTVPHLYLKNGQQGVFPHYPKASTRQLILTESIIDSASLLQCKSWKVGKLESCEVLACYGTNGLTKEHTEVIKNLKQLEEIIFFFDGDQAGQTAVKKHAEILSNSFPTLKLSNVSTPEKEDINSLMVGHENAGELFSHLIAERSLLNQSLVISEQRSGEVMTNEDHLKFNIQNLKFDSSNSNNLIFSSANAIYAIKGGVSKGLESMKVTLVVEHEGRKSRLKLDLFEDKQIVKSAREISNKLGLDMADIEDDLENLTDELEMYRDGLKVKPQQENEEGNNSLSLAQKQAAIKLLRCESMSSDKNGNNTNKNKNLLTEFNSLIGESGIVGEESARLSLFVIACSYLIKKPLHGLIQGSSGSGKTHLMNKILDLLPKHKIVRITRVTESSFYNYEEHFFKHKVLGMEDLDGLEEKALFAFRELQSKGEISSSTTLKDEVTGELSAGLKVVRGPIASLSCTTKGEIYEDNMSRSFLIAVNESKEQTEKILVYQQEKAAGLVKEDEEKQAVNQIQNALSLLKNYEVINPFATKLQLPPQAHKIRRLHELFQYFVQTITVLNQYQREIKNGKLVTSKEDVKTAIEIMFDSIMLKVDELDGSLRSFYEKLKAYAKGLGEDESFTQRDVRLSLLVSKSQLQRYFNDLLELEYIEKVNGFKNVGFKYKISYWDNIDKLRKDIKEYLFNQLEKL